MNIGTRRCTMYRRMQILTEFLRRERQQWAEEEQRRIEEERRRETGPVYRCRRDGHYRSLLRNHGVVQPVVGQSRVALYAGVAERRILVPPEREHGLVHLLGVEHLESHEQVEVLDRQTGDGEEQIWLQLGDD